MAFKHLKNNVKIPIPCENCGGKFSVTVGDVGRKPQFSCPHCGLAHDAEHVARVLKALDDGIGKAPI